MKLEPALITEAVREELSLLTAEQVAELLQVEKDWIYDQIQKGKFPVKRLGRQRRFHPAEIKAYLDGSWKPEETSPPPVRRGRPRTK